MTLYGAGFPCTSYSTEGKGAGLRCAVGAVGLHCILTIQASKPKSFFLENTKNLTSSSRHDDFTFLISALASIVDKNNKPLSFITSKVMNTLRVGGLPQNRERVYIVGISLSLIHI